MQILGRKGCSCDRAAKGKSKLATAQEPATAVWPLGVSLRLLGDSETEAVVNIQAGINTLVGPNGSGKTRALRGIKSVLQSNNSITSLGRKVHFLAAGRSSPLEAYRASVNSPGGINSDDAAVGNASYRRQWWEIESVTGPLLALDARAELRLKVEARLQQLLDRSVKLSWSQQGLNVRIAPVGGGPSYAANYKASGILQLVALLAAIHNDEIGVLLIDEPEISLHPQHQAFLLEEMERVAGDPIEPTRKIIVVATHSPTLLPLSSASAETRLRPKYPPASRAHPHLRQLGCEADHLAQQIGDTCLLDKRAQVHHACHRRSFQ